MIVPTRFGLKYAPIPTLALEYEDDLKGVVDATGESATSLYVYRDKEPVPPARKLHVVELPLLSRSSETQQITRQLQQDNGRFLAPEVVSETQLKRLLDRLVENLPAAAETEKREPSATVIGDVGRVQKEEEESELEESAMEESVMEESVAEAEVSRSDEHETPRVLTSEANPNRGAFVSHEAEDERGENSEDEAGKGTGDTAKKQDGREELEKSKDEEAGGLENAPTTEKDEESEAEEDAKKTRVLRSESDVSEEDVQSEELEYFSEDGSDEDSF